MDRSYRIRTDIGSDKVLRVNMKQNVDLFEVLSLKLSQSNMYRLHTSDYGVIVGRVLANDAFGIPNAKISVFIPITDEDRLRSDIREIYPYTSVEDVNSDNIRYNILPNYKINDCYVPVGTLPSKRLVLDNDSVLEIFDKYYRYTTTTNKSGDYMLFGIPTGNQVLHVDVDLSDIGVLSQKPRDFINKGYSIDMFESPVQFKKSTNLEELPQIYTENSSVTVYPFWGDKDSGEVAITRKDIKVQYEFTPTCVFMGSVMTDNGQNSISHNCVPDENVGEASQLVPSEGTIEMIRKTPYDSIEQFTIKGNNLIDENGVWCYQIPMNLDYVGMDEYGNIVPTDNPLKGIPTRASVRFRFTLSESGDESMTRHCARYLVPNNPSVNSKRYAHLPMIDKGIYDDDSYYQFGSTTPDDCFRDLYWNKVYTVKSYVPRLQVSKWENTTNYFAIKGVNKKDARGNNTIPFNKVNVNIRSSIFSMIRYAREKGDEIKGAWSYLTSKTPEYSINSLYEDFFEEHDGISLDFFNDWLNGCLYFPMWFWRIRKKKKYKNGQAAYDSQYCSCKSSNTKLKLYDNYAIGYDNDDLRVSSNGNNEINGLTDYYRKYTSYKNSHNNDGMVMWNSITYWKDINGGIIKKMANKDGADIYYYSAGNAIGEADDLTEYPYARLFATDIVLLGSLNECDIDGVPTMGTKFPSTTANIPPIGGINSSVDEEVTPSEDDDEGEETGSTEPSSGTRQRATDTYVDDGEESENVPTYNGMNWGSYWTKKRLFRKSTDDNHPYVLGNGLLFGITPVSIFDVGAIADFKTAINASRMCELGVTMDSDTIIDLEGGKYEARLRADGLITKNEIEDLDSRAMFASMNMNKLIGSVPNNGTGYKTYDLTFMYPTNFDGRLEYIAPSYTNTNNSKIPTSDDRNKDYIDFRLGKRLGDKSINGIAVNNRNRSRGGHIINDRNLRERIDIDQTIIGDTNNAHFYRQNTETFRDKNRNYAFPLYENSFYFFFGLKKGSTAIDVLRKNFYTDCTNDDKAPFGMKIKWEYTTAGSSGAVISLSFINIGTPYTVYVDGEEKINEEYKSECSVSGLTNGEHTVSVTDVYGNTMSEKINIQYPEIKLNAILLNNITTKYTDNPEDICEGGYYAKVKLDSFEAYGCKYSIEEWDSDTGKVTRMSTPFSGCTGLIGTVIVSSITPNFVEEYLCDDDNGGVEDGNVLKIKKPGTLAFLIREGGTDNSSIQRIDVTDTGALEMTINSVPLKHIVGYNESTPGKYNNKFRNPNGSAYTSCQSGSNLVGWFGLHDPKTYGPSDSGNTFNYDKTMDEDWVQIRNYEIWGTDDTIELVKGRLNYMFKLCDGAYITDNGSKKSFRIKLDGGDSENLLRAVVPNYETLPSNNVGGSGSFSDYLTTSGDRYEAIASLTTPNIVSYNYRYTNENGLPEDIAVIDGDFDFNPKYADSANTAGNYFAGFTNNANLVKNSYGTCQHGEIDTFQRIPAKVNDIAEERGASFCYDYEGNDGVESPVNDNNPYLRTEFIDRRLDYDMLYITPCNVESGGTWSKGRLSGVTFNGIEMLYDDSADKVILSTGDNTEYKYNVETSVVTFNNDKPKRFFESTLKYGDGKIIDLRNAYHSKVNTEPYIDDSVKIIKDGHSRIGESVCGNFGLSGTTVNGYPTLRYLDIKDIPYGDTYEYKTVSCSYNGIIFNETNESITAYANGGETVSYRIETGEIISLVPKEGTDEYNFEYTGNGNSFTSTNFSIDFNINAGGSDGFLTKIDGEFGLRAIGDDVNHSKLSKIKSASAISIINEAITENTLSEVDDDILKNHYDTDSEIRDKKFNIFGPTNDNKFLVMLFDRRYFSTAADSLMKRIRVINTSTIYDINDVYYSINGNELTLTSYYIANNISSVRVKINNEMHTDVGIESDESGNGQIKVRLNENGISFENECTIYLKMNNGLIYKFNLE